MLMSGRERGAENDGNESIYSFADYLQNEEEKRVTCRAEDFVYEQQGVVMPTPILSMPQLSTADVRLESFKLEHLVFPIFMGGSNGDIF